MAIVAEKPATEVGSRDLQRVAELLGGSRVLSRKVVSALDAHELILGGLPASALDHLVGRLRILHKADSLEKAVGMSVRTYQRRKEAPSKPLSQEQSGRAWKFAEILAKASDLYRNHKHHNII